MQDSCQIDGLGPFPVRRPSTPEEAGDFVRQAAADDLAIFPLGGRTMLDVGLPPDRAGIGIDLTLLAGVVDYPARDMTITVGAGIRLAELQRILATEGQRLPIDVPRPDQATLGGSLAVNVSGSRRLGAGTARDYVIGITTINDEGQQTKAGGRVVKNVAGYDLCKLHVGALGTLGIISQVTLKIRPRPEAQAVLTFGCDAPALATLLDRLHASRTRPMCLDLLNASAAAALRERANVKLPTKPWVLLVGYEDTEAAVNWQIQQLIRELAGEGIHGVDALAGSVTDALWQHVTDLTLPDALLSLKASVLPSRVAAFCQAADRPGASVHAHAGNGIVRVHFTEMTPEGVPALLKELTTAAGEVAIVLPRCPSAWKASVPVWGTPRSNVSLMRQVKGKLDPRRLFNPGRFVGGM